jgi:hypothetical protein
MISECHCPGSRLGAYGHVWASAVVTVLTRDSGLAVGGGDRRRNRKSGRW